MDVDSDMSLQSIVASTIAIQVTDALSYTSNGFTGLHDTVLMTGMLQAGFYQTTLTSDLTGLLYWQNKICWWYKFDLEF
jgi:hypothetical protein